MFYSVPKVRGVSMLKRKSKEVIDEVKNSNEPVFLSERDDVSVVLLNVKYYDQLMQNAKDKEDYFWLSASEQTFDFWNHPSNDAYEQLL